MNLKLNENKDNIKVKPIIDKDVNVYEEDKYYEYKEKKAEYIKKELNIKDEEELNKYIGSKYDIIKDKLNRLYVILYIYKGISFSNYEVYELNRLKMIRLYISYEDDITKPMINLPDIFIKNEIENVDIDLNILLTILKDIYGENKIINKMLSKILEKYEGANEGDFLGSIKMVYDDFIKLVNKIRYVMLDTI